MSLTLVVLDAQGRSITDLLVRSVVPVCAFAGVGTPQEINGRRRNWTKEQAPQWIFGLCPRKSIPPDALRPRRGAVVGGSVRMGWAGHRIALDGDLLVIGDFRARQSAVAAGPSSVSMVTAAGDYAAWIRSTAAWAEQAGAQAKAAAGAYEAALAMTVPPAAITANRGTTMSLAATNVLGQYTRRSRPTKRNTAKCGFKTSSPWRATPVRRRPRRI